MSEKLEQKKYLCYNLHIKVTFVKVIKMEHTNLYELIEYLKYGTKLNISVVFLNHNGNFKTELPLEMAIHAKEYCNHIKSTSTGYKTCVKCRNTALKKAIDHKKPFGGLCFNGVYEYCLPVCEDEGVIAVIFVGNIYPKNPDKNVVEFEDTFEKNFDEKKCENISRIIENQIKLLINEYSDIKTEYNPLISNILNFIAESYTTDIRVDEISKIFGYNEKYIGKLFLKHIGKTIKEYVNEKRLSLSTKLLRNTDLSITEIALKSGFNNVTYFNRLFKQKYNMSPNKYRK